MPELREEGDSRLTYELEPVGESVKLTILHEMDRPDSKLIGAVSEGWPHLMASLKSLLETGEPLAETRKWLEGVRGRGRNGAARRRAPAARPPVPALV